MNHFLACCLCSLILRHAQVHPTRNSNAFRSVHPPVIHFTERSGLCLGKLPSNCCSSCWWPVVLLCLRTLDQKVKGRLLKMRFMTIWALRRPQPRLECHTWPATLPSLRCHVASAQKIKGVLRGTINSVISCQFFLSSISIAQLDNSAPYLCNPCSCLFSHGGGMVTQPPVVPVSWQKQRWLS